MTALIGFGLFLGGSIFGIIIMALMAASRDDESNIYSVGGTLYVKAPVLGLNIHRVLIQDGIFCKTFIPEEFD